MAKNKRGVQENRHHITFGKNEAIQRELTTEEEKLQESWLKKNKPTIIETQKERYEAYKGKLEPIPINLKREK